MPATSFDDVDLGEASESASVALGYTGETADGATWTGSFGFEKVLAVNGGGAKATAWQLGINRAKDGWTIGAAAAVTDNGDGTEERAFGLAVLRVVSEKLTLSGGLNLSHSGIGGADLSETSLSLIGLYQIAPDTAMLEAGIWQIRTDDAGARSQRTVVGLGVSLYF